MIHATPEYVAACYAAIAAYERRAAESAAESLREWEESRDTFPTVQGYYLGGPVAFLAAVVELDS